MRPASYEINGAQAPCGTEEEEKTLHMYVQVLVVISGIRLSDSAVSMPQKPILQLAIAFSRTMRAELILHFEACMTDIYLHIDARMANYIRTHP